MWTQFVAISHRRRILHRKFLARPTDSRVLPPWQQSFSGSLSILKSSPLVNYLTHLISLSMHLQICTCIANCDKISPHCRHDSDQDQFALVRLIIKFNIFYFPTSHTFWKTLNSLRGARLAKPEVTQIINLLPFINANFHYHVHKSLPLDRILSQMNPFHALTLSFIKSILPLPSNHA